MARFRTRRGRRGTVRKPKKDIFADLKKAIDEALFWASDGYTFRTPMVNLGLAFLSSFESEFIAIMEPERLFENDYWRENMMNVSVAKLWVDYSRGILCARFPFKEAVVNEIREKIPKGKKEWSSTEGVWHFSIEVGEIVADILFRHFREVIDLTKDPQPVSVVTKDALLAILPEEDRREIYRMLAKKYHPDRNPKGGDMMAKINMIFKEV